MTSNSLVELDRLHLVHPVASYRGHERRGVRILKSASGATLTDSTGHRLVTVSLGSGASMSGMVPTGIVEAATRQMRELPKEAARASHGASRDSALIAGGLRAVDRR
jgi:putrescine aminotransferase